METGAVFHAGGHADVHLVMPELDAAAGTAAARLRPGLAAAAARAARAAHRNVERHRRALARLARRNLERGCQRLRVLLGDKRAANAVDGRRHRRKVDDDLVGEPPAFVADLIAPPPRHRMSPESAEPG